MFLFLFICIAYCRRRAGGLISIPNLPRIQCESELDGGYGRYPREIAAAFPPGVVIFDPKAPGRNLFCNCDESAHGRMICNIVIRPGSYQARIILTKLELFPSESSDDALGVHHRIAPFFVMYLAHDLIAPDILWPVILYSHPECTPNLLAEIQVTRSASQMLSRAQSSPGRLSYAWRSMPISQCQEQQGDETTCPIMLTPFVPGQVVYILQSDVTKADAGNFVQCISAEGLRKLSASNPIHKFRDPLRREGDRMLTIKEDYEAYVLGDDSHEDCERSSSQTTSEPTSSGKAPTRRQVPLPSPSTRIRPSSNYHSFRPGSVVVPGVVRRQPRPSTSDHSSEASSSSDARVQLANHHQLFTNVLFCIILTSIIFLHFCSCSNFESSDDVFVVFTSSNRPKTFTLTSQLL